MSRIHLPVRATFTCPVCGKVVTLYCRRDEWGYWYNDTASQIEKRMTYLCSGPCAKAYEDRRMAEVAARIAKTLTYQAIQLVKREGITYAAAGKRLGLEGSNIATMCDTFQDHHFKVLEWMERTGYAAE